MPWWKRAQPAQTTVPSSVTATTTAQGSPGPDTSLSGIPGSQSWGTPQTVSSISRMRSKSARDVTSPQRRTLRQNRSGRQRRRLSDQHRLRFLWHEAGRHQPLRQLRGQVVGVVLPLHLRAQRGVVVPLPGDQSVQFGAVQPAESR
ncbi:hypothetical protein PV417_20690 [Streptomyces sp. ME19-03-3]|nr:hypothetical protein [Streptomyces sp. ME19-03-3]